MEVRKAIGVHHTPTTDESWDGPGNVARLKNDESEAYYKKMFAWQDPDGDPTKKNSFKFPHHEVSSDGVIGAANVRGCIAGIAILNGARGGADIPDADRKGVWNHLAVHMRDADMEPPELKSESGQKVEYRTFNLGEVETRAEEDNTAAKITGHAAVFNEVSADSCFYREKIAPGAFRKTIKEADVRALFNHDPNFVLGRTKNGTLKLKEDDKGLYVEITPPNTQWARDLIETIRRGDVDQMSFGFYVVKEEWEGNEENLTRILKEVKLFDVSPVVFPAYPQTDVQVRSLLNILKSYFPDEPFPVEHSADASVKSPSPVGLAIKRRQLEIAGKEI